MPASLVLKTIELTEGAPRKGFAVVTASTYDGRNGVQITDVSLPPVAFKRPRQKGWTYHFAGDGLLIHQWDETPSVFGYTVFLTITSRMDKALEIAGKSTSAAGALASPSASAEQLQLVHSLAAGVESEPLPLPLPLLLLQ